METPIYRRRGATRRDVIKTAAGVGLLASVGSVFHARPAHAAKKTLKILQWSHFVPGLRQVVQQEYVKEWGDKNDTEVIVDNINLGAHPRRAPPPRSRRRRATTCSCSSRRRRSSRSRSST